MSCLENIVNISALCDSNNASLSGYDLLKAPEVSYNSLAKTVNEKYVSGLKMAQEILKNAITDVKNDFLTQITSAGYIPNVLAQTYKTSEFNSSVVHPAVAKERGLTLYKNQRSKFGVRKLVIKKVSVFPKVNVASASILVYDNGMLYTYPTTLTGNLVNTITINHVVQGSSARVVMDNTSVQMGGSTLTCFVGCNGTVPNDCGYTKGYNGDGEISAKEGYGIGLEFTCECDYDELMCSLSRNYVGKLIYLKARIGLLEETIHSTRLNGIVLFTKEEAKEKKEELQLEYLDQWDVFLKSLPNVMQQFQGECITCKGIKYVTNI